MSDVKSNKPKMYKNPHRKESKPNVGHYTPQYKKMGLTPEKVGSNDLVGNVLILKNNPSDPDNPRTRTPTIRQQPYAESVPDKFINNIPNVGNNMEHSWSGVDGEILDDLDVDPNTEMVDNNNISEHPEGKSESFNVQGLDSILNVDEGQYILLIDDVVVAIGNKDDVVDVASSLVFGEHDICEGNPVPIDNISVLKKVPIKVGLFLE